MCPCLSNICVSCANPTQFSYCLLALVCVCVPLSFDRFSMGILGGGASSPSPASRGNATKNARSAANSETHIESPEELASASIRAIVPDNAWIQALVNLILPIVQFAVGMFYTLFVYQPSEQSVAAKEQAAASMSEEDKNNNARQSIAVVVLPDILGTVNLTKQVLSRWNFQQENPVDLDIYFYDWKEEVRESVKAHPQINAAVESMHDVDQSSILQSKFEQSIFYALASIASQEYLIGRLRSFVEKISACEKPVVIVAEGSACPIALGHAQRFDDVLHTYLIGAMRHQRFNEEHVSTVNSASLSGSMNLPVSMTNDEGEEFKIGDPATAAGAAGAAGAASTNNGSFAVENVTHMYLSGDILSGPIPHIRNVVLNRRTTSYTLPSIASVTRLLGPGTDTGRLQGVLCTLAISTLGNTLLARQMYLASPVLAQITQSIASTYELKLQGVKNKRKKLFVKHHKNIISRGLHKVAKRVAEGLGVEVSKSADRHMTGSTGPSSSSNLFHIDEDELTEEETSVSSVDSSTDCLSSSFSASASANASLALSDE